MDTEVDKIDTAYYYMHNDIQEALSIFNEILKQQPDNLDAINGKASVLIKLKQFDEAEEILKYSLSLEENSSALINLGIVNKNKGQYSEALTYLDRAIEINPQLNDIVTVLKRDIIKKLELDDSIKIGNFNLEANKLVIQGLQYEKEGKYWDAIECYESAVIKDSSSSDSINPLINKVKLNLQNDFLFDEVTFDESSLGRLKRRALNKYLVEERVEVAFEFINDALELDPADLDMLNYKGAIEFYFENYEESLECFDQCLEVNPEYTYALFNKALVLRRLKKYKEALICLDKVLENMGNNKKIKEHQRSVLDKLVKTHPA